MDPVLRAKLWQHMRDIVDSDGITIVITTHYIEEAKFVIGFQINFIHTDFSSSGTRTSLP